MWLNRRGMTLTEVLIYCAILGLFSGMLFLSLPSRTNASLSDLEEATVRAGAVLERVSVEVSNSSSQTVQMTSDLPGLVFATATDDRSKPYSYSGEEIAWRGWIGYLHEDTVLRRYWLPFGAPRPAELLGPQPTVAELKSGQGVVVLTEVESFEAHLAESGLWRVALTTRVGGSTSLVETAVGVRN